MSLNDPFVTYNLDQNPLYATSPTDATWPVHLVFFDLITSFEEQIIKILITRQNTARLYSPLPDPNILLSNHFARILFIALLHLCNTFTALLHKEQKYGIVRSKLQ